MSCAHFLREIFKDSVKIDVYEGNEVGGRLATTVMKDGNEYETGGSVIHQRNRYMSDFVNNFGEFSNKFFYALKYTVRKHILYIQIICARTTKAYVSVK